MAFLTPGGRLVKCLSLLRYLNFSLPVLPSGYGPVFIRQLDGVEPKPELPHPVHGPLKSAAQHPWFETAERQMVKLAAHIYNHDLATPDLGFLFGNVDQYNRQVVFQALNVAYTLDKFPCSEDHPIERSQMVV